MSKRRVPPPPPGQITVLSKPGLVEVLPGYEGPRRAKDLSYTLPPRIWRPGPKGSKTKRGSSAMQPKQLDGRAYTVDKKWSGLRFIFKVDHLSVKSDETIFNLFTTHLGREVNGMPHWTEVGIIRAAQDTRYRLFTYDNGVDEDDMWGFFGTTSEGEVFEFAIRLNETDTGPYRYETYCSGRRVRTGTLPRLDCRVDVSHESFARPTDQFSQGDHVLAVEGWVNYPPNRARWFSSGLNIAYGSGGSEKGVKLAQPTALKFESYT